MSKRKSRSGQNKETRLGPDNAHRLTAAGTFVQLGLPGEGCREDVRDEHGEDGPRITPTAAQNFKFCQPS